MVWYKLPIVSSWSAHGKTMIRPKEVPKSSNSSLKIDHPVGFQQLELMIWYKLVNKVPKITGTFWNFFGPLWNFRAWYELLKKVPKSSMLELWNFGLELFEPFNNKPL